MGKKPVWRMLLMILVLICISSWILSQSSSFKSLETEEIKDLFRDDAGFPYPYGIDSYYHLKSAEDILDHGHPGETIKDNEPYTFLRLAPKGVPASTSLYPYIIAYFHKVFFPSSPLTATAYFLPILLGIMSVLLMFFIGKELFGTLTGFYAALIFSFHPFFITWNYAGFVDTNAINLFLSLIIMFSVLKLYKTKKYAWGVLGLVTLIVFFKAWKGAFYIIAILCFIAAAISILKVKKPTFSLIGIAASLFVLFLIYGDLIRNRLFPSNILLQSIQELKPVSFLELIQGLGGAVMAVITVAAISLLIIKIINNKDPWKYAAVLAWLVPLCIAGIMSRRFLYYTAPAIALSLGIFWQALRNKSIILFKNKTIITLLLVIAIPILLWNSVNYVQQLQPPVNDAMIETMNFIKHTTEENAIITTIAGKGYAYQYFSHRGTVIDTGKLTHPRRYTIAEFFLEKDEEAARNILKQMNCGIDLNMTNGVCPPALVVVDMKMGGNLAILQQFSHFEQEIKMSKIKRCTKKQDIVECANGFSIIGNNATRNKGFPKIFYDYRGEGKKITNYNNSGDVAFILYDGKQGLYSFMVTEAYADAMLLRFIAQDTFDNFSMIFTTEFPEQYTVYETRWEGKIND